MPSGYPRIHWIEYPKLEAITGGSKPGYKKLVQLMELLTND